MSVEAASREVLNLEMTSLLLLRVHTFGCLRFPTRETSDEENIAVWQLLAHQWISSDNYTLDPDDRVTAPHAAHCSDKCFLCQDSKDSCYFSLSLCKEHSEVCYIIPGLCKLSCRRVLFSFFGIYSSCTVTSPPWRTPLIPQLNYFFDIILINVPLVIVVNKAVTS